MIGRPKGIPSHRKGIRQIRLCVCGKPVRENWSNGVFKGYYRTCGEHSMVGSNNPFYGQRHTEESLKKMSESHKGKSLSQEQREKLRIAMTGRVMSGTHLANMRKPKPVGFAEKLRIAKLGKPNIAILGDKNPHWKGGVTPINRMIRTSLEYRQWRRAVLERDRFMCINCGHKSKGKVKGRMDVVVDHIKPFCLYPELRLVVSNGRTLCIECDKQLGWRVFRERNPRCLTQ